MNKNETVGLSPKLAFSYNFNINFAIIPIGFTDDFRGNRSRLIFLA